MAFCPESSPASGTATGFTDPSNSPADIRCNPNKLLIDPYSKAIDGYFDWNQSVFGYNFGDPDSRNDDDSAVSMPKSVVINPFFDWGIDRPPRHEYADTIIYEAHVKGLTQDPLRHPRAHPRHVRRDRPPRDHRITSSRSGSTPSN